MKAIILCASILTVFANPIENISKHPVCGCSHNQLTDDSGKSAVACPYLPRCNPPHCSVTMEPFTPFAGPCANGLPPWHHFDRPFNDDSGYASEDSDSAPFLSLDPANDHEYTNQVNHGLPWMQRHRTAALISAPWSHPVSLRACHPFHDLFSDSYDLPQPLPFEEPPNDHVSSSQPQPPPSYHGREVIDRGPGHTASPWDLEEKTSSSPLDFAEHRARIPDAPSSLSKSETAHRPPSPNPLRLDFSSPDVKTEALYPLPSITSARPHDEEGYPMPRSAPPRPHCQYRSARHDAAAWRQLYHERTQLEKDRRASCEEEGEVFITT